MRFLPSPTRRLARRLCVASGVMLLLAGLVASAFVVRYPWLLVMWRYRTPPSSLTIPVEGMIRNGLRSTFHAPRDGGRRKHQGADLFARRGTPVLSATRGTVIKVGTDRLGGNVVTVFGEGPAIYYYAHLDEWAPGLRVGDDVAPGTLLGTVGNTGNARTTPAHLHFGIYRVGLSGVRAVDPVPELQRRPVETIRKRQ